MWTSLDTRRTLFDRAVVWLVKNRVLLPGITVLARAVAEVRSGELALVHAAVDEAVPASLRRQLGELLAVPDGQVFSTLDVWRTPPKDRTGKAQKQALERASQIKALGAGEVDVSGLPRLRASGAGPLRDGGQGTDSPGPERAHRAVRPLCWPRSTTLETTSVDDALVLFDALMATNLLAKADREGQAEKARAFPKLPHRPRWSWPGRWAW